MLKFADYRTRAKGLADLLPYAALAAPGVVINKDGSFLAAFAFRGMDTESSLPRDLEYVCMQFNNAIRLLGNGWMLHVDALRASHKAYGWSENEDHFPDAVTRMIDQERRELFGSGVCFTTTTVLAVTYKPDMKAAKMASKASGGDLNTQKSLDRELERFTTTLNELEEILSSVLKMDRLREYETDEDEYGDTYRQSDLLAHLQQCLIGDLHPVRVPDTPMYLDSLLASEELVGGIAPRLGKRYMAVLSIDGLPQESWPSMLTELDKIPISYRWSSRFLCLDQFDAIKEMDSFRKGWAQQVYRFIDKMMNNPNARANRDAALMVEDAEQVITEVQGGVVGAGYLTSTIVLLHGDPLVLEEQAQELRRIIRTLGFGCRIENVNALEAWEGSIPGNSWANLRRPMLHTLNLAHLLPLSGVWSGKSRCPCPFYPPNSPPLAVVTTDGATPIRLNLHVGDTGHFVMFGPTGSGKSVGLNKIAAQFFRYRDAQVFAFDKGMSMFALCMGAVGAHYEIGCNDGLAFAPLCRIDTHADRAWAAEWIEGLLGLQGMTVLPLHVNSINDGLDRLAGNPQSMRGLREFFNAVPNKEIKDALLHYTTHGAMGHLLDAQADDIGFSRFTVFEIEELMNMGDKNALPVLTYLFREIERRLDGRPTLITLDEAWIMLGHPVFRSKIREWLKTLRKKNCAVGLATQSLSDAKSSGITDVIAESCLTKFFLPNLAAREPDQLQLYHDLGCNDRIVDLLAQATPKRDYFLMTPEGRRMFQWQLLPKAKAFVAVSDPASVATIKELIQQYGPEGWQQHWLRLREAV